MSAPISHLSAIIRSMAIIGRVTITTSKRA